MPVEPLRVITDQWEWASIAKLVPTVYHEQSWTLASVARIRAQTSLPVSYGYARVWVAHDTLVGCPLIRFGNRWFNTPRAAPLVLAGCQLNAASALLRAAGRSRDPVVARLRLRDHLELHDDRKVIRDIDRTRLLLDTRTATSRRYRTMSTREINLMVRSLSWASPDRGPEWGAAIKACWNAGAWTTTVNVHADDAGATIGFSVWVERPASTDCIAAAIIDQPVPAWTSYR